MSAAAETRDRETEELRAKLAAAERERDELRARAERAEHERNEFRKLYELVLLELERLKRQLFGQKAEAVDPNQVQLAFAPVLEALERARIGGEAAAAEVVSELDKLRERAQAEVARRKAEKKAPKPHGRRDLSLEDLPVERITLEPPERLLPGGEALVKIGEEVSEHIDRRSASLVRVQVIRPKYKVPEAAPSASEAPAATTKILEPVKPGAIVVAALPERPIPRGIAGPGLLAHVLVSKYADHLPLHRQEKIFRREGLHLPRSTLCGFVQGSVALLGRIVDAMWEDAKANARWVCIDATGVLVFAKEQCRRNHFWVVVAEREHVLFRFTKTHDGLVPAELLKGFRGYVLADASAVYHELYRREAAITEVGCWAHARRRAFDALSSDEPRALVLIGFIGLLYDAHMLATDPRTGVTDGARRKADAAPVVDRLYAWIETERSRVDDDAPIAKAMNYIVNHRVHLTRFLDDGLLRLDNNLAEAELRREKVGGHNWLYCGSDDGAHWNATAVSLIASCQLHDIEPWAYLRDVLTLLPSWPAKRVLALAPKYWKESRQQPDTQQRLASLRLLGRNHTSHAGEATART
ncbi:MAG TPA: IS66 family transposase [Anaeromyxobacteraceae bacterium]|nr:IS66 family transposase [Anaeromyxobacteraceae bacterium]